MIGRRISHYQVLQKLGEGGMGVVYKAEDTKLERPVALKFLPAHLLGSEDVRKRFEREAKASAALAHPNVCRVYEIDEAEDKTFLAMELIEGESLDKKIARGPLKLEEALSIGQQVAKGLEAAHKRGIVHRDIKPENVMVGEDGHVTIMDFGLAQLTEASRLTKTDETLGTVAYMSPEQTEGSGTDHRTDIWSLGVVLYEMITGRQPFKGDYDRAVMYSILNEQPEAPTSLRTGVPMQLEILVLKCLAKKAEGRYQNAGDLIVDLRALGRSDDKARVVRPKPRAEAGSPRRIAGLRSVALVVAGLLLGLGAAVWLQPRSDGLSGPASAQPLHFTLPLPEGIYIQPKFSPPVAISPDGRRILYVGSRGPRSLELYLQDLGDGYEPKAIPDTQGATVPFFSPDGGWIGFVSADNKLTRLSLESGARSVICSMPVLLAGASWGPDDTIVFAQAGAGLSRVSASGGIPSFVTTVEKDRGEVSHYWPQFLPDGDGVAFTIVSARGLSPAVFDLSGNRHEELPGDFQGGPGRFLAGGAFAYAFRGELLGVAPSSGQSSTRDNPRKLLSGVRTNGVGLAAYAVSQTGTLVYVPGEAADDRRKLVLVDRDGRYEPIIDEEAAFGGPRFSPDGSRIVLRKRVHEVDTDLWIYELSTLRRTRLTTDGVNRWPVWSPDGERVTFTRGFSDIFWTPSQGSASEELLLAGTSPQQVPTSWSPDGDVLLFDRSRVIEDESGQATEDFDLWILRPGEEPEPFLATDFNEMYGRFSPDGRWVAYVSDESGREEVHVRAFEGVPRSVTISTRGGLNPVWSRDGRELFYFEGIRMMSVDVTTDENFRPGRPELLFEWPFGAPSGGHSNYFDVSPDGERFVAVENLEPRRSTELRVVVNWAGQFDW